MDLFGEIRGIVNASDNDVLDAFATAWSDFKEHAEESEGYPQAIIVIASEGHWMVRTVTAGPDRDPITELGLLTLAQSTILEDRFAGDEL